jgi:predicted dehydrogenase
MTTAVRPTRIGIVGCGDVSNVYLKGLARYDSLEIAACADLDAERASRLSGKGGFPAVPVETLLADPAIEIVLNLTPPLVHASVSMAAIAAGKHVYSEKPLATTRDDARGILAAAQDAGVRVGAAPDTFLGGGLQTARALIDEGAIGTPLAANAVVAHTGPERWHLNPGIFYGVGGGPVLDVGPYYVTALVHLLGPVTAVSAIGRGLGTERRIAAGPLAGSSLTSEVPTTVIGALTFESGVVGGLFASFDSAGSRAPHVEIHGTEGSLSLGDANEFAGEVCYKRFGDREWHEEPLRFDATMGRGVGLADMVDAMRVDRPHRASGELAFHVLDVLIALQEATTSGRTETIASRADRPAPLPPGLNVADGDTIRTAEHGPTAQLT